jgi:hypothetical protein
MKPSYFESIAQYLSKKLQGGVKERGGRSLLNPV